MSLLKSILKRLASSIVVLLGLTIIIFILMRIVPGDPARLALGANVSEEVLENYREINHLNDSLPMQYVYWISGAIRGDFGMSAVTKRAVIQDIKDFAPATIELVLWAGFPSILVALYLGVTSAQHKNKWQDYLCRFLGYIFVATPHLRVCGDFPAGVRLLDPCAAYDRRTAQPVLYYPGYHGTVCAGRAAGRTAESRMGRLSPSSVPRPFIGFGEDDAGGQDYQI